DHTMEEYIEHLIKRGLPKELVNGLYKVRCIGPGAVAPGVIDSDDKLEMAFALFNFINSICDCFITQPRRIHESINNLPK
ncbi:MAG: hypothetical protein ACK5WF_13885, partial [Cyclobacteriaceae bacterium]